MSAFSKTCPTAGQTARLHMSRAPYVLKGRYLSPHASLRSIYIQEPGDILDISYGYQYG